MTTSRFVFPLFFFFLLWIAGCSPKFARQSYTHPIPFQPEQYLCQRAETSLTIDGQLNERAWEKALWTFDFQDIEGNLKPIPAHRTRAKMLWDDQYFYVAAQLDEPHLWATLTERDAIMYKNDDFEIFIDPDGDGLDYYEFEMNAHNAIWDLFMLRPYRADTLPNYLMNWDIKGIQTAVALDGTLNDPSDSDRSWTVEIALPWEALKEIAPGRRAPLPGEQWRVNFSRVDWHVAAQDGHYVKKPNPKTGKVDDFPQENWVWSPIGYVDMHRPELWGYVQFVSGTSNAAWSTRPDEQIKWALWQLFYQQQAFRKQDGRYCDKLSALTLPEVDIRGYAFAPRLQITDSQFELQALTADGLGFWHLNAEGRIWRTD